MSDLSSKGSFKVQASVLKRITDTFKAYCCTEKETISTIGETYRKDGYLCDPHTAVGIKAAGDYMNKVKDNVPVVVLSTASPYKFPAPVSEAIGLPVSGDEFFQIEQISKKTGVPVPKNLSSLESKKELHDDVIDRTAVMEYVLQVLGI